MEVLWYLDRASGLVAYAVLYLSVVTGVLYSARRFGPLHRAARRTHVETSALAVLVMLLHVVVGVADATLVVAGEAPVPAYGRTYLVAGAAVGVGALFVLVVAVLGFVDARRFERPWSPRVVHAFAYAGFAFATVHAAAVGTDLLGVIRPLLVALGTFLVYLLLLRAVGGTALGEALGEAA